MSDVTTIEADVPERYADAVSTRLRRAADEDVVGRLWRRDGTLWTLGYAGRTVRGWAGPGVTCGRCGARATTAVARSTCRA